MKKKSKIILTVFLLIIIIWLVVSAYFYYQHQNTVKEMSISDCKYIVDDNHIFNITSIRLIEKKRPPTNFDCEQNFIYKLLGKIDNPNQFLMKIINFIYKADYFYSSPYEKNEANLWDIEISGYYVGQDAYSDYESFVMYEMLPQIQLNAIGDAYEEITYYITSSGYLNTNGANLILFSVASINVIPNANYYEVVWKLPEGDFKYKCNQADFKETTYNYFNRVPNCFDFFSPNTIVRDAYNTYKEDQKLNDAIICDVTNELDWIEEYDDVNYYCQTDYLGSYKDYQNVFIINMNVRKNNEYDKIIGKQLYYLIQTGGEWQIIDIGPFEKMS